MVEEFEVSHLKFAQQGVFTIVQSREIAQA